MQVGVQAQRSQAQQYVWAPQAAPTTQTTTQNGQVATANQAATNSAQQANPNMPPQPPQLPASEPTPALLTHNVAWTSVRYHLRGISGKHYLPWSLDSQKSSASNMGRALCGEKPWSATGTCGFLIDY